MVLVIVVLIGAGLVVATSGAVLAPMARCSELSEAELSANLAGLRAGFRPDHQAAGETSNAVCTAANAGDLAHSVMGGYPKTV